MSLMIINTLPREDEAAQSRCCEAFCKTLPEKLGCEYAGSIVKGDMFGVGLMPEKMTAQMIGPFREMGRSYDEKGYFSKEAADNFAGGICRNFL